MVLVVVVLLLRFALLPCSEMAVGVVVPPRSAQTLSRHAGFLPRTKHTLVWLNWQVEIVQPSECKWF